MKLAIYSILIFLKIGSTFSQTTVQRLGDLSNEGANSNITKMIENNGILYFTVSNSLYGYDLWRSDGTSNGTFILKEQATLQSSVVTIVKFNNKILFFQNTYQNGQYNTEIWETDGTIAGTILLISFTNHKFKEYLSNYRFDESVIVINSTVYFSMSNNVVGAELWKTDGSQAGTQLVKDINSGTGHSYPINFINNNGILIFSAVTPLNGRELWRSDGSENGTYLIKDIYQGVNSGVLIENELIRQKKIISHENKVYFIANDGVTGEEIWTSDGTTSGTNIIKDITIGATGTYSNNNNIQLTPLNPVTLLFLDNYGAVWKTDGSNTGTQLVSNANSPQVIIKTNNSTAALLSTYNIWKTDGTTNGTQFFTSSTITYGLTNKCFFNNQLFFAGTSNNYGSELLNNNLSLTTINLIKDINNAGNTCINNGDSNPNDFCVVQNKLFFTAYRPNIGTELWVTDGTTNGTSLVKDIAENINLNPNADPEKFTKFNNNNIFFTAKENGLSTKRNIWKSDSLAVLTKIYSGNSSTINFKFIDNLLFISDCSKLIIYNAITTITSEYSFNNTCNVIKFQNNYYVFGSQNSMSGLYKIDGNNFSFSLVKTFSSIGELSVVNNKLLFSGRDSNILNSGNELWLSDGTTNGTILLKDINGTNNSSLSQDTKIFSFGNSALFVADQSNPNTLWVTDGTVNGTQKIKDIASTFYSPHIGKIINGKLYFFVAPNNSTKEFWVSDGTGVGTFKICNTESNTFEYLENKFYINKLNNLGNPVLSHYDVINETLFDYNIISPTSMYSDSSNLYLGFDYAGFYNYIYKLSPNNTTTQILVNVNPTGFGAASPKNFMRMGNHIYFSASEYGYGIEPFRVRDAFCKNIINSNSILSNYVYIFKANDLINSDNVINYNSNIKFRAGKKILLNPGFTIESGSVFKAEIGGCF